MLFLFLGFEEIWGWLSE